MLPRTRTISIVTLTLGVVATHRALAQTDAGMFRGGPAHLGEYASRVTPALGATAWKFATGGKVLSSPVVVSGVVYVGSNDHNLYALSAADGTLKWKFATRGPVNSSPAVSNGAVFASSMDGRVYAVDAATGAARWNFVTGGERRFTAPGIHGMIPRTQLMPDPFDLFLSSPVVDHGVVYVGSGDNNVYALDAATGALKWKFATGNVVHATPAVANGVVYIGSWDSWFYALDAATGAVRWKHETGRDTVAWNQVGIVGSAAVANGVVYFGCRDGFLYALDATTGAERWKYNNNHGWVIASPAVHGGVVFFPTSDGMRFKAVNAATGALVFDVANKAISFSSPAVVGDAVIYGSSDGWLHAADIRTGVSRAEFQTDGNKQNASKYITAEGKINEAALYADMTIDAIYVGVERMHSLGAIFSSPVVANDMVFVGSSDGNVYAIR